MSNTRVWLWIVLITSGLLIGGVLLSGSLSHSVIFSRGFSAGFKNAFKAKMGINSPGGAAVAKAGKCQNATVVSSEEIGDAPDAAPLNMDFVICILPAMGDEPSCDDLANVYAGAAHPTRKFMIEVKHLTKKEMLCQRTYDPGGTLITDHLKK